MLWDVNYGASIAYQNYNDILAGSESFQICGNTAATPEPSALTLLATGIVGLGVCGWRRRKLAAT
jgi:hypothetical protein